MTTIDRNPRIRLVGTKEEEMLLEAAECAFNEVDKNKFGLLGVIGSFAHGKERGYDIDLFSSPAQGVMPGEFLIANGKLISSMRHYVAERGYHIAAAPRVMYQPETNYLAQQNAVDSVQIPVHNLVFTDPQSVVAITSQKFLDEIVSNIVPIVGNTNNLVHGKAFNPSLLAAHYIVADSGLLLLEQLPPELAATKGAVMLEYLGKHYDKKLDQRNVTRLNDAKDAKRLAEEVLYHLDEGLPRAA